MPEANEIDLVKEYAATGSEPAFSEIVRRHIDFVYSVALRYAGNAADAQDIAQAVFIILAQKASRLGPKTVLTGWLYETTRYTARSFLRTRTRRGIREQEAYMQSRLNDSGSDGDWRHIAPLLEEAMSRLSEKERTLLALRFFENKSAAETAALLGIQEWAAHKRTTRAVEKLRAFFGRRGVILSSAAIASATSANSVPAAPTGLAKTISVVAAAKGATAATSTLTLAKGALKIMAWTKAKTAIVVGVTMLLAAGTTTTLVIRHQNQSRNYFPPSSWTLAGYGDPSATVRTFLWAARQGDAKTLFASLSPDCQEAFRQLAAELKPGAEPDQFVLDLLRPGVKGLSGIRIVKSETISPDAVILDISRDGTQLRNTLIKVRKLGEEWKLDDFDPKGVRGRTGVGAPNGEFGGIGVALRIDDTTHTVSFDRVLPDSPAAGAGLSSNLVVLKVDDVSMAGKSMNECASLIRGKVGTKVRLELFNPELKETNTVELTRRKLGP